MTAPTQYVNPTTELFKVAIVRLRSGLLDIMKKLIVSDTLVSKLLTLFGGTFRTAPEHLTLGAEAVNLGQGYGAAVA